MEEMVNSRNGGRNGRWGMGDTHHGEWGTRTMGMGRGMGDTHPFGDNRLGLYRPSNRQAGDAATALDTRAERAIFVVPNCPLDMQLYASTLYGIRKSGRSNMARSKRSDVFDPTEVGIYHCTNRCVRRCFLCGVDPLTRKNYEHRRAWIQDRLEFLAAYFGIDVLGFSILGNHFHVMLRNRPDVVESWSDEEVARRWLMLCPVRKNDDGTPAEPNASELAAITNDPDQLKELRSRLSHVSWFMKMVAERIAKRANAEDQITGHFWQGRFGMRRICDDAALLACLIYTDLNLIRAGIAETPEDSQFTSAKLRIDSLSGNTPPCGWLAPLEIDESQPPGPMPSHLPTRCSDKGVLPISVPDYLALLDHSGRQMARGKSGGRIPADAEPILVRLGIDPSHWMQLVSEFESLFYRFVGSRDTLNRIAREKGRCWFQAPGKDLLANSAA